MARNLEWKARLTNLDAALVVAAELATAGPERLEQVDTYFRVPSGRLKLREIRSDTGEWAELIGYRRADEQGFKTSRYELLDVPDAARWRRCSTRCWERSSWCAKYGPSIFIETSEFISIASNRWATI
ncbi:MAG: hypothetical protein QM811_00375 [Pirellulales bacterium]